MGASIDSFDYCGSSSSFQIELIRNSLRLSAGSSPHSADMDQHHEDKDRNGLRNVGFFIVQLLDLDDSPRELHYTQLLGKQHILELVSLWFSECNVLPPAGISPVRM